MLNKISLTQFSSPPPGKSEKGQSLMEMAIVLIILLLLLAGIVDLGRLFFTWIALRDAAQEGAVYASFCPPFNGPDAEKVKTHVKKSSNGTIDLNNSNVQVIADYTIPAVPGTTVRVEVSMTNFRFIMPFISIFTGTSMTIRAEAKDVALQESCPN